MNFKTIALLILMGLFIIVCIQNIEEIPLHFLMWSTNISKLLLLLIALIVGILAGIILCGMFRKSQKQEKVKVQ